MNTKSLASSRPVLFVLASVMAWLAVVVFVGVASSVLGRPYGDPGTVANGRLAVAACFVLVLWRLDWLRVSGVTSLGTCQVWLITLGGVIYFGAVRGRRAAVGRPVGAKR